MRNRQQPLDERQAAAEVVLGVGVCEVQVDGLFVVRGRVMIVHQREVDSDPVREAGQLQIPVIPPARILLAEQQHQQDIDGEPVAKPTNKIQLEALIQRLEDEGLAAVTEVVQEHLMPKESNDEDGAEALKNA